MRHFKLAKPASNGYKILDITTTEMLFYEIDGLGFEENNTFNRIGSVWWLSHTEYKQVPVKGKIVFTAEGGTDPYTKFQEFMQFISTPPLTLLYNPFGPVKSAMCGDSEDEENAYYRTVRVGKLEKSELDEYGVLDCDIEFEPYTLWYRKKYFSTGSEKPDDGSDQTGWIWAGTETVTDSETGETTTITHPPLVFEPDGVIKDGVVVVPAYSGESTRARFRWEPPKFLSCPVSESGNSPAILTIHGPIVNPVWTHVIEDGSRTLLVGSGSFTKNLELLAGEKIVIDSTPTQQSITLIHANGTTSDLYPQRNFEETCFITLKPGVNRISVMSDDTGEPAANIEVEGYMYDAAV